MPGKVGFPAAGMAVEPAQVTKTRSGPESPADAPAAKRQRRGGDPASAVRVDIPAWFDDISTPRVGVTPGELARHNTPVDFWVAIGEHVYDLTNSKMRNQLGTGGQDATSTFEGMFRAEEARSCLQATSPQELPARMHRTLLRRGVVCIGRLTTALVGGGEEGTPMALDMTGAISMATSASAVPDVVRRPGLGLVEECPE